jgi:hypothetical protein
MMLLVCWLFSLYWKMWDQCLFQKRKPPFPGLYERWTSIIEALAYTVPHVTIVPLPFSRPISLPFSHSFPFMEPWLCILLFFVESWLYLSRNPSLRIPCYLPSEVCNQVFLAQFFAHAFIQAVSCICWLFVRLPTYIFRTLHNYMLIFLYVRAWF